MVQTLCNVKSTFRILHTLYNMGTSPEPKNLTILWSEQLLPENFQTPFLSKSID